MGDHSSEVCGTTAGREARRARETTAARVLRVVKDELGVGRTDYRFRLIQCAVGLIPYDLGKRVRASLYRLAGIPIGPRTIIYGPLLITGHDHVGTRLRIGESCRLNTPCRIGLSAPVTIGDRVSLGFGVTIITGYHDMSSSERRAGPVSGKPVAIGNGVWIAANVTILPGVTIGDGAVIGAGSVVSRDIPSNTLAVGVPARPVRPL